MKVKVVEIGILSPDWFSSLRLDDENAEWDTCLPSRTVHGKEYPATAGWRQISAEEFLEFLEYVPLDMDGNPRMNPCRETYWVKEEVDEKMKRIIFATDADEVALVEGGYLWQWFEPEPGEEFIPGGPDEVAEYFRSCGRDDIAVVVESGVPYIYGHREK